MTFCPYCGHKVPQGAAQCPKCHEALEPDEGLPDLRGSTLVGVASVKAEPVAKRPPRQSGPSSSVFVDTGPREPAAVTIPEPVPARALASVPAVAPKLQTPLSVPKLSQASAEARMSQESKTPTSEMPQTSTRPDWEGPADPRLQKEVMGDSLIMRAGDVIDPVTGIPLRAFQPKTKSRAPLVILAIMLLGVGGLLAYTYTRPTPPEKIAVQGQLPSADGATYALVFDVNGFTAGAATALRVNGIEAKAEEKTITLALPDAAVAVGSSVLKGEAQLNGAWVPVDIPVVRLARARATVDEAKEQITVSFEVAPKGSAISILDKEVPVENGKASVTFSTRAAVTAADKNAPVIEKTLSFSIAGLEGESEVPVKFKAPRPPLSVSSPKDYDVVEKKTESVALVLEAIPGATLTVTANKTAITAQDGKYLIPLKPESETVIEIKAEGKEFSTVTETRRVWRGTPSAEWLKNKPKAP